MKNRTFILCIVVIGAVFLPLMLWGSHRGKKAGESVAVAALNQPFEATAQIRLKELKMTADVNRTAPGQVTVCLTQPDSLAGMAFAYNGQDVQVSYKGLTLTLDDDSRLASSVAGLLVRSIDAAASGSGVDVELDGDRVIVSGESDAGQFRVELDKESGTIATLSVPDADFECHFAPIIS